MIDDDLLISYQFTAQASQLLSTINSIQTAFLNLEKTVSTLNNQNSTILLTSQRIAEVKMQTEAASTSLKGLGTQATVVGSEINTLGGRLDQFSEKLAKLRGRSTAGWGLTMVMAGLFPMIMKPLLDFEHSQALLQGYGGFTNAPTMYNAIGGGTLEINAARALREEAMAIGASTIKTTTEASEGLLSLAKMGWNLGQIARLGMPVTQLAIAGDMGVADAGRIAAMAMNQFHIGSSTQAATLMMDKIVNAAAMSQVSVKDMLQYLGRAGATAAVSGMNFSEFLAVASTIKDTVGGVSMTATGARSALIDMLAPTARTLHAYDLLGITDMQAEIKKYGTLGFVKKVNTAFQARYSKDDVYGRTNILNDIFGKQQAAAGNALLQQIDKIIERVNLLNTTSGGKMQMINDYLNNSLFGSWKLMQSRIENFIISLGDTSSAGGGGLTNKLSYIMQSIAYSFQVLANMPSWMKQLTSDVFLLTGGMIALGVATKVWGFALGLAETGIKTVVALIKAFEYATIAATAAVEAITFSIGLLKDGFLLLTTAELAADSALIGFEAPFIAAAAAIAAIIAGILLIKNLWSGTKTPSSNSELDKKATEWRKEQELNSIFTIFGWNLPKGEKGKEIGESLSKDYDKAKKVIYSTIGLDPSGKVMTAMPTQTSSVLDKMPKALQVLSLLDYRLTGRDPNGIINQLSALDRNTVATEANTEAIIDHGKQLQAHAQKATSLNPHSVKPTNIHPKTSLPTTRYLPIGAQ